MSERPKKSPLRFSAAARAKLAKTLAERGLESGEEDRITRRPDRHGPWPLSTSQERLWLAEQVLEGSALYHVPLSAHLVGPLDTQALERALDALVHRYEILRASFVQAGDRPEQRTLVDLVSTLPATDLSALPASQRYPEALARARKELRRPFDLAQGPPYRAHLWKLSAEEHVLLIALHHIICDGATIRILCEDLANLYAAEVARHPLSLVEPPLQHGDYAAWQRARVGDASSREAVDYFVARLEGALEPLELPTDRPRPARWSASGDWRTRRMDVRLGASLAELARAHGTTPFQLLLSAFRVLLQRLTRQEEFVVGVPLGLRERSELERLPGFLVNTLALRARVDGSRSFVELLRQTKEETLEAFANGAAPFEHVLERLQRPRDPSRTPLFDVMFDHRAGLPSSLPLSGLTSARMIPEDQLHSATSKVDLALYTELTAEAFSVSAEFRTDLFDPETIDLWLERFEVLLAGVAGDPQTRIDELPILGPGERERLEVWSRGPEVEGCETTVHAVIGALARGNPDAVAIEHGTLRVRYGDLDARANRLAQRLIALGATPGRPVALALERTDELIVALLAVLKSGAAYLPLDPNYPAERLEFMLQDSGARILVTEESVARQLPLGRVALEVLRIDAQREEIARAPAEDPRVGTGPDDPAYLIYTSGSTGTPKGVACPHRGVLRLFRDSSWLRFDPSVRMLHVAPESFDASVLDIWGPLVAGGTLVLHPERTPTLDGLAGVVEQHRIDTLFLTTALFHALVDEHPDVLERLRQVATGGEALSLPHLLRARERCPALAIANCYGPTEATVIATTWSAPAELPPGLGSAPIGAPIANTRVQVLDERQRPLPIGVPGELFVGGPAIARGYWNRPELTRERFLTVDGQGLLYRTGDLVRWRSTRTGGVLEFLGRRDEQVKIRGHRVELGEIEARLGEHAGVRRAVVVAREDVPGSRRLVAYVVPADGRVAADALARHLEQRLPEYMRPSAFVLLDELPITPGGKIDRTRLPAPALDARDARREPPVGATEELLASLWSELLGVASVGRDDDFFALGGQSLTATVLMARVRRHFGLELPLATLFRERTLANLARSLDSARRPQAASASRAPARSDRTRAPLSPNQRGLWFLQQLAPQSSFYNVPFVLPLRGVLDEDALARSLEAIVARHEILRTRFPTVDGTPVQEIEPAGPRMEVVGGTLDPTAVQARLREFAARPFDLERGPVFRTLLLREGPESATLAVNAHHIVFDGWSLDVLLDELRALYEALASRREPRLAPLELRYADHAAWLAERAASGDDASEAAFWKTELDGAPLVLELPTDHPRPARPSWRGGRVQRALPAHWIERLRALTRAEGTTPYMALMALVQVLLARHAGVEELVVGTPVAARSLPECERLIGLFLNVVAIRSDLSGDVSFRQCLARTRERVLRAHAHQDFPFERLVEVLEVARDPAVTPVYQAIFSLRKEPVARVAAGLQLEPPREIDAQSAKTDIAITIEEREGDWLLDLTYAAELFEPATVQRLAEHFEQLLASALANPDTSVWKLEIMSPSEQRKVVEEWSGGEPGYPRDLSLAVLFERIAKRHAGKTALVRGDERLTYAELEARANRLARQLVALGVGRESRVGLCADRSFDLIVAVLAILKAGGAYVPLDPAYPAERLSFMLQDAGVDVLLLDPELEGQLPRTGVHKVFLTGAGLAADQPSDALPARSSGADPAYVMYTSGSTGRPKGVEVLQRSVSRLVLCADYVKLDETRTLLQLAPISFDASTLEIWGALLVGGTLALYPDRIPSAEGLDRVLHAHGVTTLWLTAALFNMVVDERPEALDGLAECLTGGEALSVAHVRRAYAEVSQGLTLINGYGPTENTTFTCCHRIPREIPAEAPSIPIGRPVPATRVYVVDARLQAVPIGVPGELVTGGDGLARGYLGRPELTAERFVPSPFGPGKLYRTGDRVRWSPDGTLEFLGRNDDQVKIRGHRIEPGEIATLLATEPRVRKAFVTVHDSPQSGKQIVAYFEPRDGLPPRADELSSWLASRLPDYMLPASFVQMEALPMNPNGKVDRKRLPEPSFESRSAQRPRNEMEGLLASIWESVLGVQDIGPEDDFFELGGHSLLAVKLVQGIREAFGQELELSALLGAPTLSAQAMLLHSGVGSKNSGALVRLQPKGERAPVFCVCSLGGTVLNQRPLALRLGEERPFYGLQAIDLESRLGRSATIEDYASAYIEAMKKVAPRGPYVIGGHSFGGIVSFEIAQQLTGRGDEVEMLFILDSSLPNLDKGALDRLACVFAFLRGLPYVPGEALTQMRRDPEQLTRALRQKLRFVTGRGKAAVARPQPMPVQAASEPPQHAPRMDVKDVVEMSHWPENNRRIAERHWRAVLGYRPKSYPGRITLFRSRFQSPFLGLGMMMGWERVALGGVEVVRVPGGHLSVLQPPNVDVLARRFLERLGRRRRAA